MRNSNRQKVIANRRRLKGTGIGVHEVLTQASKYIFDATKDMAKSVSKVKSVWAWQGVTHVLVDDGQTTIRYRVHSVKKKEKRTSRKLQSNMQTLNQLSSVNEIDIFSLFLLCVHMN